MRSGSPATGAGVGLRADAERGSALLLMPAGVLILLILAALSFDLGVGFQRKRALLELADAAANDAVTAGLDQGRLRVDGRYCLDATQVRRSVAAAVTSADFAVEVASVQLLAGDGGGCATGATVVLRATRPAPFTAAIPGASAAAPLEARATASVVVR